MSQFSFATVSQLYAFLDQTFSPQVTARLLCTEDGLYWGDWGLQYLPGNGINRPAGWLLSDGLKVSKLYPDEADAIDGFTSYLLQTLLTLYRVGGSLPALPNKPCSMCQAEVRSTPAGLVCTNGHGGVSQ